jgi:hypothetical protein
MERFPDNGFAAPSTFTYMSPGLKYARSFHWGMTALISMGGSSSPESRAETSIALITMALGIVVFATLISQINNVISDGPLMQV